MILSYTDDDDDEVIYEDGAPSLPSADDQHFQAAFEVKYICIDANLLISTT